ncbi:HET-domain-containing protein [Xylariaceae sp. FL0804]|nr:HET-domain-containing protein [Xylariaceae sp. FL0804]
MTDYEYGFCKLDRASEDIRVLEILDNGHPTVECNLCNMAVNDHSLKYAALSWNWGGSQPVDNIHIIHGNKYYDFRVPPTLEQALRELRRLKVLRIWVDFICIDQQNHEEKSWYVPMMSAIYGNSVRVYVWLGSEPRDSALAMQFIENEVLNLGNLDNLLKKEDTIAKWSALSDLIKRPWFSRRWVIQEIALARDATLFCGSNSIEWMDFADAISLLKRHGSLNHMPDFYGHLSESSATKLVEVINNLFRRVTKHGREPRFSLEYLISTFTAFGAAEARDTVYSLLAIARDTIPKNFKVGHARTEGARESLAYRFERKAIAAKPYPVDYGLPLSDVYVQFVKWLVKESEGNRALDMICRPWVPQPRLGLQEPPLGDTRHWRARFDSNESKRAAEEGIDTLPSWIPTVAGAAFDMDGLQRMSRKNGDSLVGLPADRTYSAAGSRRVTGLHRFEDGVTKYSDLEELNGLHYHSMFVEGFILDAVEVMCETSQQGNIPKHWKRFRREAKGDDMDGGISDEFLRTLVEAQGPNAANAPRYYARLIRHAFDLSMAGDTLNTAGTAHWNNCEMVGDLLGRVRSVIWNRRMMRTKQRQTLGFVPERTTRGDLIAILYGCSVPVVLRPFRKTDAEVEHEKRQREQKKQDRLPKKYLLKWRFGVARSKKRRAAESPAGPRKKRARASSPTTTPATAGPPATGTDDSPEKPAAAAKDAAAGSPPVREPLQSDPAVFYQLIGECYVDGVMNGEAITKDTTSVLFELR